MALLMHSVNSLQYTWCNTVVKESLSKEFLSLSTYSFSQGVRSRSNADAPRAILPIPTIVSSDLVKTKTNFATQKALLTSHQICDDYVLAGPHLLGFATKRLATQGNLLCRAAASSASASSGAQADYSSVTLLGRHFEKKDVQIACTAIATVLLASSNKILYKMALVSLKGHPLFLAQFNTLAYVAAYSSILLIRYRAGIVTEEMLALPKTKFALIGALEALAIAMGMASAAVLPGAIIPVLAQVFLVWQLILSATILRERYTLEQVGGCLSVIAGVVVVVASGSGGVGASTLQQSGYLWPLVMIFSTLFLAGASILKEVVFRDGAQKLKGGNVDIFVVNTFGSLFQTLCVSTILPLVFRAQGVPFHDIPHSLKEGYMCFVNIGSKVRGCEGAPLVPLLYTVVNMAFNICSLSLLKNSSAIVSSLCVTLSIPLSIWAFTLPWPYLGAPPELPPGFFLGAAILVAGLALYSLSKSAKKKCRD